MDLQLVDEVAVVVGAAKGIGRTIAAAFGSEGAARRPAVHGAGRPRIIHAWSPRVAAPATTLG